MSNQTKWALFDTSWLAHRARNTIKGMEFEDLPTGVIFGFFEQMRGTCFDSRVATNQVGLCFDSAHSTRRDEFPDYKRRRLEDRTEEEWAEIKAMHDQLNRLRREILPQIGFKVFRQPGLESDDLMAKAVLQAKGPAVMITADGDLYQCITGYADWFDPMRDLYLTWMGMLDRKGVEPWKWAEVKCLAGCPGDGVPGVPGVGVTTAIQYLQDKLPSHHKRYLAITSREGKAIAARNRALVVLPRPETKELDLSPPVYKPEVFFEWCSKLGLKTYLNGGRKVLWEKFFRGDMSETRQVARKRGTKNG